MGWLRANVRPDDPAGAIADKSDDWACFGLWGPAARDVLGAVTDDDVSDAAPAAADGRRPSGSARRRSSPRA